MNTANRDHPATQAEASGGPPPRARASADYERPRENVADMPDPVDLPANKARAGVRVKGMWLVLTVGIALTLIGYIVGYYLFYT
jgi:hypothetical protein